MHYVYTDHLGSLNVITNQSGAIEQELSFDAWGNRRNPDTWVNLTGTPANLITRRGFTAHEHIDEFGIINMNGRLYDPVLGRFLSPDPIIGDPGNTQSYNRYSYVVNNPLMFTDPSGYRTVPAFQYHSYLDDLGRKGGDGWGGFFWTSGSPHVSDVLGLNNNSGSLGYKYLDAIGYMDAATGEPADYQTAQAWAIENATKNGDFASRLSGDYYRLLMRPASNRFTSSQTVASTGNNGYNIASNGNYTHFQIWEGDNKCEYIIKTGVDEAISNGIGQPGFGESLIPIWGSGRAAIDHFQNGNIWRGLAYSALAVSDVFLVKALVTAAGKAVVGTAWKTGSHTWGATRSWIGRTGQAAKGQPVHHWAISQATAKGYGLQAITNQPWNLIPMESQVFHQAIHGVGPNAFGPIRQFMYGTPTWFKATLGSVGGRIID